MRRHAYSRSADHEPQRPVDVAVGDGRAVRLAHVVEAGVELGASSCASSGPPSPTAARSASSTCTAACAAPDRRRAPGDAASCSRPNSRSVSSCRKRVPVPCARPPPSTCRRARRAARRRRARRCRRPRTRVRPARGRTSPANTEIRSNSSCSIGVSSSYDHCTRSRSVRCRGSVARREPASTRKRSGSRSASSAGLIDRMRAAASSSASGHAVEADADLGDRVAVVVVEHEVGARRARPLDEQLHRGHVDQRRRADRRRAAGTGSGGTDHTTSAGMPSGSRLVASTCTSGHHSQHQLDQLAGRVEHVLAVVEHEQQPTATPRNSTIESASERFGALLHVERVGDRRVHRALVAHRGRAR